MVPTAELAAMRAAASASGDVSLALYRPVISQDGEGNVLKTWPATPYATVQGNLAQPTASQLQNYGYAIADLATWMVRLPVGTGVDIGDRIVANGQNLEVQIALQPQSYQVSMRVLAAEVKRT